jgi:hypothetical protein
MLYIFHFLDYVIHFHCNVFLYRLKVARRIKFWPVTIPRSRYSDWMRAGRPRGPSLSPGMGKNFLLFTSIRPVLGPIEPPFQWVPGGKAAGTEADHRLPTSAEVKNTWIRTSTPPYFFMA